MKRLDFRRFAQGRTVAALLCVSFATVFSPVTADARDLSGPTETHGVESVESIGEVDLAAEFPAMAGRQMRARIFTIAPGGVVAQHTHKARPGYAYILSGQIVEHRNDADDPIIRKPGDVAIEQTGVAHWWENESSAPVRVLVIDIFTPE